MKPPATAKARGTDLEYRVKSHLEAQGYETIRSAGSGGKADIWAAKDGRLLLLQVKRAKAELYSPAWNDLLAAARRAGGEAILVSAPLRCELCFERLDDFRTPLKRHRPASIFEP